MRTIVDLHMHSHYSRATSKQLTVAGLARTAEIKGVDIIATGDITHPRWIQEIERETTTGEDGFLHYQNSPTRFILSGEISCIYSKEGKYHVDGHRVCNVQFTPEQTRKHKGLCPKCGMPLVVGVLNRVD